LLILNIDPETKGEDGTALYSTAEKFRLLTLQKEVISSVLGTTARIDEARLKGKKQDRMAELLASIREAEGS